MEEIFAYETPVVIQDVELETRAGSITSVGPDGAPKP